MVPTCNYHLRSLRCFRHALTSDIENSLAFSAMRSRIDYFIALLLGVANNTLSRLYNCLARAVFKVGMRRLFYNGRTSKTCRVILTGYQLKVGSGSRSSSFVSRAIPLGYRSTSRSVFCSFKQDQLTVLSSRIKLTSRRFSFAASQVWMNFR